MGFRFRRSVRILPGVRVNVTSRGVSSVSLGRRGFTTNIGKRGVRRTIGIPGTGISYSTHQSFNAATTASLPTASAPVPPAPDRFGIVRRIAIFEETRTRRLLLVAGVLVAPLGFWYQPLFVVGGLIWLIGLARASATSLQAKYDKEHRQLVDAEVHRRLTEANEVIERSSATDSAAIRDSVAIVRTLELSDAEIGHGRLETMLARADLVDYVKAAEASNELPVVGGHEAITAPHACRFVTGNVLYDRRCDDDPTGTLYLTDGGVMFKWVGGMVSVPWTKVASVERDGRELLIQRKDRQTPWRFWISTERDRQFAFLISKSLWQPFVMPRSIDKPLA